MRDARVMIVEDESITAKDIEALLLRLGYHVPAIALSGEEAIEKAAATRPDLVLMDIKLKGAMDGVQAADQLRARFGIPVTYLTAFADEATLARAQATAPYGYLVKPFEERELHATIQMALERHHLERQLAESERWLATVLGAVGDGIIATDADGHVQLMNPTAESLTGWQEPQALGKELAHVFCTTPSVAVPTQSDGAPGPPEEVLLLPREGRVMPVEVSATTARDSSNRVQGFVWAFRNIEQRKRIEDALREKEAYFRSLIEQASDVIAVVDRDGTVYYASPSTERVLGYTPAEMLGTSVLNIVHPSDASNVIAGLARAATRAESVRLEVRAQHRDGSWRVFEVVGSPLPRSEDTPQDRFVVNARDTTERQEAEDQLRDELEVSAALTRLSREMIASLGTRALLDELCRVTTQVLRCDFSHTWLWNAEEQAYATVAGHGDTPEQWESMRALKIPGALLTRLISQLETEEIAEIVMSDDADLMPVVLPKKYGITACLYVALHRGGRMVGVQTAGYRGRDSAFSPQQRRIAKDIGRLASLALEHVRLIDELEESNLLKSDLMAALSHELRGPLGSAAGMTELLLGAEFGPMTAEQSEQLKAIDRGLRKMRDLVNTLLDFGRVDRSWVPLDLTEVEPASLLAEVRQESVDLGRAPEVDLAWEIEPQLPPLRTDPAKLKVVIKNLLANALRFTEKGSVRVSARSCGPGIEFRVADTGIGIACESREAIFEPFRQLRQVAGHTHGGVGLGLYITRRLLEMLGGRIQVESTVGRGSVFRAWVPRESKPHRIGTGFGPAPPHNPTWARNGR